MSITNVGLPMIHEAESQLRPGVITIFTCGVCTSVLRLRDSKYLAKQSKFQVRILIATGGTVGLAEWIIDYTSWVNFIFKIFL